MQVEDIPINKIKVINPLRKIDESNVEGLMTSIKEINLLHPIQVAKQGDEYVLLSGGHRKEAFSRLGREVIPAVVREDDELAVDQGADKRSISTAFKKMNRSKKTNRVMVKQFIDQIA